jgi:hypothetical protein
MTLFRLIPASLRSGLLILVAPAVMALPFLLALDSAAIVLGTVLGTAMLGLGIAGTANEGRGTLPLSQHAIYDRGLALGLLLTAVIFGLIDQPEASLFFAAVGTGQLLLTTTTRYSPAA